MDGGLLSLRWNDHSQTFFTMLSSIRKKESYCDVTLVCDGRFYPVHKLVLSTCSDFFDQVFSTTACKHPVIVVANVANKDLEALLNYMYLGEVNVLQTELTGLMKAAEVLRIKGLAEPTKSSSSKESRDGKRSSSWDTESPDSKRRKPEEVPVIQSKLSSSMGNLAASGSEADGTNLSKEQSWSRTSANDSSSKDKTHIPPGSGVSSNNSGDSAGNQQSSQQEGEQAQGSSEQPQSERALNPEVKLEEVLVKDEPSGWYPEGDETVEGLHFNEPDTSLTYGPQASYHQGNTLPWELANVQGQVMEGELLHGMPGPSGLQMMQDCQANLIKEEQLLRSRKYEATRRPRNFVESWRLEFDWVCYDSTKRVMTCSTCVEYWKEGDNAKSRFVTGNNNFKRLALVRHEESQAHHRCEARRAAALSGRSTEYASNTEEEEEEDQKYGFQRFGNFGGNSDIVKPTT